MKDQELQQFRNLSKEVQALADKIGAKAVSYKLSGIEFFYLIDFIFEALGEDYKKITRRDGTLGRTQKGEVMKVLRLIGASYNSRRAQVTLRKVRIEELEGRTETLVEDYNGNH